MQCLYVNSLDFPAKAKQTKEQNACKRQVNKKVNTKQARF